MFSNRGRVALITGATGFVGSHLAGRLARDGWGVHVVVRPKSNLSVPGGSTSGITSHVYDGDVGGMQAIMEAVQPKIVFNLASYFVPEHSPEDVPNLIDSNLRFSTQLLEAMSTTDVSSLVNTGTSWQHYENQRYNPVNLYAATKQAFEDILRYYVEARHFKAITLVLFETYGPGDRRPKLFNDLKQAAVSKKVLRMSPGAQLVDLVYIDDVVEAYLKAADRLMDGLVVGHERYAVTSGSAIPLSEVVGVFEDVANASVAVQWGGRDYREREVMVPWQLGAALPGWTPKVSLREGLKTVVEGDRIPPDGHTKGPMG